MDGASGFAGTSHHSKWQRLDSLAASLRSQALAKYSAWERVQESCQWTSATEQAVEGVHAELRRLFRSPGADHFVPEPSPSSAALSSAVKGLRGALLGEQGFWEGSCTGAAQEAPPVGTLRIAGMATLMALDQEEKCMKVISSRLGRMRQELEELKARDAAK
ncbi:hypothetical protein CYMTET_29185, partial [Cymbomonas tetramitiformis]